jgi:hypothetical protein
LTGDIEQTVNRVLAATFPQDIKQRFQQLRDDVAAQFESFSHESLKFDPSLQEFAKQTLGKVDFSMKAFEGKLFASHKKKSQETRDRIYRLWHTLYPNQGLQERSINAAYFIARYGPGIVSFIYDQMEAEQTAHQLLSLTEYTA